MGCNETIRRKLEGAMTVDQLIERLREMPSDAVVLYTADYGDHSHTTQAIPVECCEELEAKYLYETAYSISSIALREDDGADECDEDDDNEWLDGIVILR